MALPAPRPGSTALVTGASSGIGLEFARQLAERGHGVALVARRAERVQQLAAELSDRYGVRVDAIPADLTKADERQRVVDEIEGRELSVEVLVNNAGFGIFSSFAASDLGREFEQLDLLVACVMDLNGRYLPQMLQRGRGAILNISSTAGFQALPGNGTYAASKAFVLFHSEALHAEVSGHGVTVTAVCPGPVRTEFQDVSDPLFVDRLPGFLWRKPSRVAADSLEAADRGKRIVIPGGLVVRALLGANRLIPAGLTLAVSRRLMGRELERERIGQTAASATQNGGPANS